MTPMRTFPMPPARADMGWVAGNVCQHGIYLSGAYLAGDEDVLSGHIRGFQSVCNLALILQGRKDRCRD